MTDGAPFKRGNLVWSNFPYDEAPREPAEDPHIVLVRRTILGEDGTLAYIVVYTTTNPHSQERHFERIDNPLARSIGQKPFTIDASRVGHLPITREFFPYIDEPGRGVAGHLPQTLQESVRQKIAECSKPGATTPLRVYGPESTLPARPVKAAEKPSRGQTILDELKARPGGLEGARAESRASANAAKPTLSLGPRKTGPGIAD